MKKTPFTFWSLLMTGLKLTTFQSELENGRKSPSILFAMGSFSAKITNYHTSLRGKMSPFLYMAVCKGIKMRKCACELARKRAWQRWAGPRGRGSSQLMKANTLIIIYYNPGWKICLSSSVKGPNVYCEQVCEWGKRKNPDTFPCHKQINLNTCN